MIEELSLYEELTEYKENLFECIDNICNTICDSFEFFSGPWNESLNLKYQDILNDIPNIIKEIESMTEK